MKEASRQRDTKAPGKAGQFYRGVEAKAEGGRRKAEGGRRKAGRRLHCWMPWCLVALMPSVEPQWQAWFWLGALFGAGAFFMLRLVEWFDSVKSEFGEDRLNGPLHGDGLRERLHARTLTDEEHREMLLQCHASAMLHPLHKVDIRGVPVLWGLSEEQRERFLRWVPGQIVRWVAGGEDQEWEANVQREGGYTFLRFWRLPVIIPREETEKVIVVKGGHRS